MSQSWKSVNDCLRFLQIIFHFESPYSNTRVKQQVSSFSVSSACLQAVRQAGFVSQPGFLLEAEVKVLAIESGRFGVQGSTKSSRLSLSSQNALN